ncbi:MAG TPA: DUF1028 domain-containing protein [Candidatus Limnocylindria bacterium]|nr:DUF1028 domain-containing protein [Candidatus Limnocylindria bacterium]
MTYSIVARDPETGRFGVAVQSHYLSVGPVVPWLEAGVGAVATQASVNVSFGPIALEMLRAGWEAQRVVDALVAGDPGAAQRQLGVVDAEGRAAAYTGAECILACGDHVGEGYTVQGNLLASDEVWSSMAPAFEAARAEGVPFWEQLMRALEAAEAAGGDVRGRQSAAMQIVDAGARGGAWRGRHLDLRVEDHADPIPELRRILTLDRAYALLDDEGDEAKAGRTEAERYAAARAMAPDAMELVYWMALQHAEAGRMDEARREMAIAFGASDGANWRATLEHMRDGDRVNRETADALLDLGET